MGNILVRAWVLASDGGFESQLFVYYLCDLEQVTVSLFVKQAP